MIIIIFLIAEVIEKSVYHSSNDWTAVYAVPPIEPIGSIKYTAYNETVTNICRVQEVQFAQLDGHQFNVLAQTVVHLLWHMLNKHLAHSFGFYVVF